ncbi:MAG: hypothetical protein QJR01_08105, partial [Kyrpidia sp.]|nr:hypothetical protein [Kyrpidia sp.]
MVFLAAIGLIGLLLAAAFAVAALFKRIAWKTAGWTAGGSVLALVVASALGAGQSSAPSSPGNTGSAPTPLSSAAVG